MTENRINKYSMIFRYKMKRQKFTGHWSALPIKEEKDFSYMKNILKDVFMERLSNPVNMQVARSMDNDDPRRISRSLNLGPRPTLEEVLLSQTSRFGNQSWILTNLLEHYHGSHHQFTSFHIHQQSAEISTIQSITSHIWCGAAIPHPARPLGGG